MGSPSRLACRLQELRLARAPRFPDTAALQQEATSELRGGDWSCEAATAERGACGERRAEGHGGGADVRGLQVVEKLDGGDLHLVEEPESLRPLVAGLGACGQLDGRTTTRKAVCLPAQGACGERQTDGSAGAESERVQDVVDENTRERRGAWRGSKRTVLPEATAARRRPVPRNVRQCPGPKHLLGAGGAPSAAWT